MSDADRGGNAAAFIADPRIQLPAVAAHNERVARKGFWRKLRRMAGRIPFAEDAVAAYCCAIDPGTPVRVRATLFAALAYFVMPADAIPDMVAALGFTDDATVLATTIALVGGHLKDHHRIRARRMLDREHIERS